MLAMFAWLAANGGKLDTYASYPYQDQDCVFTASPLEGQ